MRCAYAIALSAGLAGCVAQAAPPVTSTDLGGGGGGGGGSTITSDTMANCEALTPAAGDMCFPTDTGCPYTLIARSAGTWSYMVDGVPFDVTPPPTTGWTALNSGSVSTVSAGCPARVLSVPAETTSGGLRGEYRTDPAFSSWGAEFVILTTVHGFGVNSGRIAAGMTDGTGVAEIAIAAQQFRTARWTNATTFAANDVTLTTTQPNAAAGFRVRDDGTLRHFDHMQADGSWSELGSGWGRTVTITGTDVGWWTLGLNTSQPYKIMLVHYDSAEI